MTSCSIIKKHLKSLQLVNFLLGKNDDFFFFPPRSFIRSNIEFLNC